MARPCPPPGGFVGEGNMARAARPMARPAATTTGAARPAMVAVDQQGRAGGAGADRRCSHRQRAGGDRSVAGGLAGSAGAAGAAGSAGAARRRHCVAPTAMAWVINHSGLF